MYLLDTNVISELRKPNPHGAVAAWYAEQQFHHLALPSVVVYELQAGANRTRRQDPLKAEELDSWIDSVIHAISVLPFGAIDARLTATFMHKRSIELFPDAMIAATAAVQGLIVVTRNTKDFSMFPIKLLNPFLA